MSPRKEYSPHKRTRITTARDLGISAKGVAYLEGVSLMTVYGVTSRYRVQKSGKSQLRSGWPPLLGDREKRCILRTIASDLFISNSDILTGLDLPCKLRTLTRFLKKEGIEHVTALRRPKLSEEVAKKRLIFARLHIHKPLLWWKRVIFSDETIVARGCGEKQKWVFCRAGERLLLSHVQPRMKPTRHLQMFWGAFCFGNRTHLKPLLGDPESKRGGVNAKVILACLQETLPTICEPGSIFMQDNASTYTAKLVQDWLRLWAAENGIELMDWPPYSPDLNPIENLWKLLKEDICKRYLELADLPKNNDSLDRLCRAAVEVWEDLEDVLLQRLVELTMRRLEAVIAADGWYTKY